MTFFATHEKAASLRENFPQSLDKQPLLLPGEKSTQRVELLAWFDRLSITPDIVAEFEDSAVMKLFGQAGYGIFCAPSPTAKHVMEQYDVVEIGYTSEVSEDFYLISPERKLKHPASLDLFTQAKALIEEKPSI